jgi:6-phosphofructokinase 1
MKKIGIFTSGGDSPGMNACIRAIVRTALYNGITPYGIFRGYDGMIDGEMEELTSRSVSNIIQRGGTILKSARSSRFMTKEGRKQAFENLQKHGIDGIVAIGGDGTFAGAKVFENEFPIFMIGIPGTIDNDLAGTDFTIGYDTAINTVVQAVDKIRDTASSHNRLFFIEVMGKDAGFIALRSGIGVGAEAILVPESKTYINELIVKLKTEWAKQKSSLIIIVAEGDDAGGAYEIAKKVKEKFDYYDTRVAILGHIQRGGSPSAMDRVLSSRLGFHAVLALKEQMKGVMVGIVDKKVTYTPFEKAIKHNTDLNKELLLLSEVLSY